MDLITPMIDALNNLGIDDFETFKWYLCKGLVPGIDPIPKANLENVQRRGVVDCMVEKYSDEAGKITVQALRKINQNHLAKTLESKLQEVQQSEPEDGRNASESVEDQCIQSDWSRPHRITRSSQEFKSRILRENRKDVYIPKDKSERKRLALLITNVRFKYSTRRAGASRDEENMEWLLTALGYRVEKYRDQTGKKISARVKNFAARPEHKDSDSTFVVLMSHGKRIRNKDVILGVDYHHKKNPNDFFFVDDIFSNLNSKKCPALNDKPKVILIQACRGKHAGGVKKQSDSAVSDSAVSDSDVSDSDVSDADVSDADVSDAVVSDSTVHREKDFICFKSCLPGIVAYRHTVEGSYLICYIMDVFSKQAHIDDIMELFRKVTLRMENDSRFRGLAKLMPCIDRTPYSKKLYLFPGL